MAELNAQTPCALTAEEQATLSPSNEIDREEWIARCAAQLATGMRMTPRQAYESAVACYEAADPEDSPEYAANEELFVAAEVAA